jgi:hypothetical protein
VKTIIKASIWGAGIACALTLTAIGLGHFWPEEMFFIGFILSAPTTVFVAATGIDRTALTGTFEGLLLLLFINALIGGFFGAVLGGLYVSINKPDKP